MKKLMIALAAVAMAACANAASMKWNVLYSYQPGADTDEGPFAKGWAMACFDANNGVKTADQLLALIAAGDTDTWADYAVGGIKKGDGDGGAMGTGDFIETIAHTESDPGEAKAFLVLFNNGDVTKASQYFATGVLAGKTITSGVAGDFIFGDGGDLLASADPSGWAKIQGAPIPEPTTGLLLLLGMGALVLRRRRA